MLYLWHEEISKNGFKIYNYLFNQEPLCRPIVCNTIRLHLMYKSLYNRDIYLQILTADNSRILSIS